LSTPTDQVSEVHMLARPRISVKRFLYREVPNIEVGLLARTWSAYK